MLNEYVQPDHVALQNDLAHVADLLSDDEDPGTLDYVAQFVTGVADAAEDGELATAARALSSARRAQRSVFSEVSTLIGLVHRRLETRIAI